MAPPQWAYQVENFVTKPDEELVCSICHAIFCDPVMCPCDHVFCQVCINKWLQNNRNCPICRKRIPRYHSPKQMVPIVKNLIMKLTLYCRNKEHGCDSQFTLESCESHMKDCNFELVLCKNKPCKEKLFRKDVVDHETSGCPHRSIKCKTCGSKMSSVSSPEDHNCIRALLLRLRSKRSMIQKKNNKIKELRKKIKSLKDTPRNTADYETSPSTISSISPDEIMINIAGMESGSSLTTDSDNSSDSLIAIFANSETDNDSDNNQSDSFSGYIDMDRSDDRRNDSPDSSDYRNAESQTIDDQNESQNDSHIDITSFLGYTSSDVVAVDSTPEERRPRRPAKRRHPPPLLSTSDEENGSDEHRSLPSPKRCWRTTESSNLHRETNAGDSSNGCMDPGPSQSYAVTAESGGSNDGGSTSNTKWRFRSKAKLNQKPPKTRKTRLSSKSPPPPQGSAVFERTLALLEQYNLESDPEWLPEYASHRGNDTTIDSDSSFDIDAIDDSSSSLSDCEFFSGDDSNNAAPDILNELYSTSDDDTDWRPGLEDNEAS